MSREPRRQRGVACLATSGTCRWLQLVASSWTFLRSTSCPMHPALLPTSHLDWAWTVPWHCRSVTGISPERECPRWWRYMQGSVPRLLESLHLFVTADDPGLFFSRKDFPSIQLARASARSRLWSFSSVPFTDLRILSALWRWDDVDLHSLRHSPQQSHLEAC